MTDKTKAVKLRRLGTAQAKLASATARADILAQARDKLMLAAQADGATYADIEEATGLSTARVTQVLRRARNA